MSGEKRAYVRTMEQWMETLKAKRTCSSSKATNFVFDCATASCSVPASASQLHNNHETFICTRQIREFERADMQRKGRGKSRRRSQQ